MAKKTVTYEREDKLPGWATPDVLRIIKADGKSLREIARMFNVSHETIRQLIKKASK